MTGTRCGSRRASQAGRAAIEAVGAECWIGTPDRIATLRYALDGVTLACWLLGTACGEPESLAALYGTRLEFFVNADDRHDRSRPAVSRLAGSLNAATRAAGRALISEARGLQRDSTGRAATPTRAILEVWIAQARTAIAALL